MIIKESNTKYRIQVGTVEMRMSCILDDDFNIYFGPDPSIRVGYQI
jgi:hypothetical protein